LRGEESETTVAYCVKCKKMRQMKNPRSITINGRHAKSGTCPVCGSKVFRIRG
jgi:Zn finger protein HypA/HybF involved in hydrogenase expression